MQWLRRWLGHGPQLTEEQQQRWVAWKSLPPTSLQQAVNGSRCVVVDVETSGLNLMEDRLISIGAVAVVNGKIVLGDSFSVVLQQPSVSDKENILLHGIGGAAQTGGVPAAEALLAFLEYLGKAPLIAFHVTFDQTMIQRAMRQYLGCTLQHTWLDLAYLMPALYPPLATAYRALDDWIGHFNIRNNARHNALADALVTAQLLQVALKQAQTKKIDAFAEFVDLEKAQRWVSAVG